MNKQDIIKDIEGYVGKGNSSAWYVGITNDIDRRLFGDHNVDREKDYWIYRTANSKSIAQEILAVVVMILLRCMSIRRIGIPNLEDFG